MPISNSSALKKNTNTFFMIIQKLLSNEKVLKNFVPFFQQKKISQFQKKIGFISRFLT
jgi:hypothetical protein